VKRWSAQRVAAAAGASLEGAAREPGDGPRGAAVDSRALAPGELFVGLPGERDDGGEYAAAALAAGAWGVVVSPAHAETARAAAEGAPVLVHAQPLAALQSLAHAWRMELGGQGARVVAITGSTGKTSTKDILAALLALEQPTAATPANLNTEIGLPLAILGAPERTRFLVLEMAMRGAGQIAELTRIAAPDVGVIVNVGPAHLELLGSLAAIAAAKAELIAGLAPGTSAIVPAGEPLLAEHLRPELRTITFGEGGDVLLAGRERDGLVRIRHGEQEIELRPTFSQAHNLQNLLAAVAAAVALGVRPAGLLEVEFSAMRGERRELAGGVLVIDDCYNANPMSMRAALEDLVASAPGRTVAVLGDMLELGPQAPELHREIGLRAAALGIDALLTVGPQAAAIADGFPREHRSVADADHAGPELAAMLHEGDTVLVKGSRGVGLERVLADLDQAWAGGPAQAGQALAPGARGGRR
jgi:UDP-N-acetylmuramoyl-tripeptide--D-alanyl-D-alanine ligase